MKKSLNKGRINNDPNNHAFKFNKYSPRKSIFGSDNKLPIVSYIEPWSPCEKPKGISFAKMTKRKSNFGVKDIPSIGYYKPNVNAIKDNNMRTIKFVNDVKLSKKFHLQKLWRSYSVGVDYKLVGLEKLNDRY
jgi:hypothetical protein